MKNTNEIKKEVLRHHKKWITIYLLAIIADLLLSGIAVYQKWWIALLGIIYGFTFSLWRLSEIRTEYKYQLKKIWLESQIEKERQLLTILQKELEKKKENKIKTYEIPI